MDELNVSNIRIIQENYIRTIKESVYCILVGQDVSPRTCLESQGQEDCFGCSASSHFCKQCQIRPLAFPEIELCDQCLHESLENETGKTTTVPLFKSSLIQCCLVKKEISIDTCKKMQGKSCGNCLSPARICTNCKEKPVKYTQYGLCLSCTVKIYAPDWQYDPEKEIISQLNNDHLLKKTSDISKLICIKCKERPINADYEKLQLCQKCYEQLDGKPPDYKISSDEISKKIEINQEDIIKKSEIPMCAGCKQRPIYYKESQLCKKCYMRQYNQQCPENNKKKAEEIIGYLNLIEQAKDLALKTNELYIPSLKKELKISRRKAQLIMRILEAQNIVGPYQTSKPRKVLLKSETVIEPNKIPVKSPTSDAFTADDIKKMNIAQKIQRIKQFCDVMGNGPFPILLLSIIQDLQEWEKMKDLLKQIDV